MKSFKKINNKILYILGGVILIIVIFYIINKYLRKNNERFIVCLESQILNSSTEKCMDKCQSGLVPSKDPSKPGCVFPSKVNQTSCPEGTIRDIYGNCHSPQLDDNDVDVVSSKKCVTTGGKFNNNSCICPEGKSFNTLTLGCECPKGSFLNSSNGKCVPNSSIDNTLLTNQPNYLDKFAKDDPVAQQQKRELLIKLGYKKEELENITSIDCQKNSRASGVYPNCKCFLPTDKYDPESNKCLSYVGSLCGKNEDCKFDSVCNIDTKFTTTDKNNKKIPTSTKCALLLKNGEVCNPAPAHNYTQNGDNYCISKICDWNCIANKGSVGSNCNTDNGCVEGSICDTHNGNGNIPTCISRGGNNTPCYSDNKYCLSTHLCYNNTCTTPAKIKYNKCTNWYSCMATYLSTTVEKLSTISPRIDLRNARNVCRGNQLNIDNFLGECKISDPINPI